ncbi:MAG: ABC transporter permease [Paracoccaceae bacterium]
MSFYLAQGLTGLANAASLFLIASGLSIIFGVTRVVNFAHGSLYMLGAYLAVTLAGALPSGPLGFWTAVLGASAAVAALGAAIERGLLSRLYRAPELFQLLATFALVLVIQDAVLAIWGPQDRRGPRAPGLDGAVRVLGEPIPEYDLALIAIGPAVLGLLWLLLNRTRWGTLVRAATEDREMVAALGGNEARLFTATFALGAFLAGLGGALAIPREAASLSMDLSVIAEAFVVVVIGGMGSLPGAFVAAVLISVANAFAVLVAPSASLVLPFVVMAVVLVVRPHGLFGRPGSEHGAPAAPEAPLGPLPRPAALGVALAVALVAGAPLVAGDFALILMTDVLIAMLLAASLHFMMGVGGMVSFGHAAWFGLGAYGVALAVQGLGLPMTAALAMGPLMGLAGAAVFGWFCVRLSGVYLAMLTLAAAQILWGVALQWQSVTGGDDGVLGLWPASWASSREAFFWLALALAVLGLGLLRHAAHAPFGYALRAGRDSPRRSEAIGLDVRAHQWAGFALAAAVAGLAGALFAFAKGSVFPDALSIATSVDALVMVLLGGVQSLAGPLLGAGAFVALEDAISRLDYWRAILGGVILTVCLLAPDGIAGGLTRLAAFARRRRP